MCACGTGMESIMNILKGHSCSVCSEWAIITWVCGVMILFLCAHCSVSKLQVITDQITSFLYKLKSSKNSTLLLEYNFHNTDYDVVIFQVLSLSGNIVAKISMN